VWTAGEYHRRTEESPKLAMKQEFWQRAESLFHAALERPPEARPTFLDQACGEDVELRRQVEDLVSKAEQTGSFLEEPVLADLTAATGARASLLGRQVGPYRILSLLGTGGMGEVYRAHDSRLGREVAIKTLPPGFAHDPARLARFRREARTLARSTTRTSRRSTGSRSRPTPRTSCSSWS
jgi:serine/threonine protein kinase